MRRSRLRDQGEDGAERPKLGWYVARSSDTNTLTNTQTRIAIDMAASSPTLFLIAGPTASGKSALAMEIAERVGAIIINADSMQVYRDLQIITARPSRQDESRVPHRLYGHVDAAETYSAGRWLSDARAAVEAAQGEGRPAVLVGGTGLYFKLAASGLAAVPPIPDPIRTRIRMRLSEEGPAALHAELARWDPQSAARLHPGDRSRIARALEVLEATGRPIGEWHRQNLDPAIDVTTARKAFIVPDRDVLRQRINQRFDGMLEGGAVEEVRRLASRSLDPKLPALKAHGVPWLIRHLRGEISLEEAAEEAKADTRRYSKRQLTWFRNQLPEWPWMAPESALDFLLTPQMP